MKSWVETGRKKLVVFLHARAGARAVLVLELVLELVPWLDVLGILNLV
jgi:hypothetical protein